MRGTNVFAIPPPPNPHHTGPLVPSEKFFLGFVNLFCFSSYRLFRVGAMTRQQAVVPKDLEKLIPSSTSPRTILVRQSLVNAPIQNFFHCMTRTIWATYSRIRNSIVHCSSPDSCFTSSRSRCSALELKFVSWVCEKHNWNGLTVAKSVCLLVALPILIYFHHASENFPVSLK